MRCINSTHKSCGIDELPCDPYRLYHYTASCWGKKKLHTQKLCDFKYVIYLHWNCFIKTCERGSHIHLNLAVGIYLKHRTWQGPHTGKFTPGRATGHLRVSSSLTGKNKAAPGTQQTGLLQMASYCSRTLFKTCLQWVEECLWIKKVPHSYF